MSQHMRMRKYMNKETVFVQTQRIAAYNLYWTLYTVFMLIFLRIIKIFGLRTKQHCTWCSIYLGYSRVPHCFVAVLIGLFLIYGIAKNSPKWRHTTGCLINTLLIHQFHWTDVRRSVAKPWKSWRHQCHCNVFVYTNCAVGALMKFNTQNTNLHVMHANSCWYIMSASECNV